MVIAAVLAGHTPVVLAAEDANSQISIGEKQAHLSKDKKESNLSKDKIKLNNQAAYMGLQTTVPLFQALIEQQREIAMKNQQQHQLQLMTKNILLHKQIYKIKMTLTTVTTKRK